MGRPDLSDRPSLATKASFRRFLIVLAVVVWAVRNVSSVSWSGLLLLPETSTRQEAAAGGFLPTDHTASLLNDTTTNPTTITTTTATAQEKTITSTNTTNTTQATAMATAKPSSVPPPPSRRFSKLSACLLIKDDNEILNEWIAYHFHLWNLRTLVVAVDPSSQTSPQPLLERWAKTFSSSSSSSPSSPSSSSNKPEDRAFLYILWQDQDYMPEQFLQGDYSQVKARLGELHQKSPNRTFSQQELQQIYNHRFRQREFYRKCLQYLDNQHQSTPATPPPTAAVAVAVEAATASASADIQWIAHIDTDEYMSLNPWLLEGERLTSSSEIVRQRQAKIRMVQPLAGALLELLLENHRSVACVGLPRLFFGGVERQGEQKNTASSPLLWNRTRLESMRWKYHAPMIMANPLNGKPKVLLNWNAFQNTSAKDDYYNRQRDKLLNNIHSIHQPHPRACPKRVSFDGTASKETGPPWLAIHHYLGSEQRFMSRDDPRRTREIYMSKANQTEGPIGNQMDGWLEQFVLDNGFDKVSQVLADYLMK